MKLYDLIQVSRSEHLNPEIIVVFKGLHYQFYAKDFENFGAFKDLKDLQIGLVCPYNNGMQIYTK